MTQLGLSEHESLENKPDWRMWALSVAGAVVLILGGVWMTQLDHRLGVLEDSDRASSVVRERLSAAEVRQSSTQRQLDADISTVKESMKRVEDKLDQLLYREVNPGSTDSRRRFDK